MATSRRQDLSSRSLTDVLFHSTRPPASAELEQSRITASWQRTSTKRRAANDARFKVETSVGGRGKECRKAEIATESCDYGALCIGEVLSSSSSSHGGAGIVSWGSKSNSLASISGSVA